MFRRAVRINKERFTLTGNADQPGAGTSAIHHIDHRETSIAQKKLVDAIGQNDTVQSKKNDTGLPDDLKMGIEDISGLSMDDVRVHYNSSMPKQLNAHAYAQGMNIHIATGQEKHLPHEAWHVVQQAQGRVKPTRQVSGNVNINDDRGLENEADTMAGKIRHVNDRLPIQQKKDIVKLNTKSTVVSRIVDPGRSRGTGAPLQLKHGVIQLGTGPYGRDVDSLSFENILIFLYDLLDFISFGFLEDLTRLINLHRAHDAEHAVAAIAARRIEAWIRFIFRVLIRSGLMYLLIGLFPPGVIGFYLSLLISNVLNWLNERLIVIMGEYAHHEGQGTTGSALALGYLRWVEGVEPESADYTVVRRSGRRTGDTGRAMGSAEQMPGGRLSAQDAAGGLWNFLSRHFRYEWGHRQADSQRGTNTSSNLGSESMGANSQEMVSEAYASDLSRANPGNVRRRNFALRFAGALFDRIRRITTVVNGNPLITESVRADRGPMTSLERTTLESDYANERSYVVGLNLRNSAFVPIVVAILLALVHFIFF